MTGVIVVFLLDAGFVAILLWVSAWRSEWSDPRSALIPIANADRRS